MFLRLLGAAAPLLLFLAASAAARADSPITPADLARHIDILAADDFEGRLPGTQGEARTVAYISEQLRARGVEPAGEQGWFQQVDLVERTTRAQRASWSAGEAALPFDQAEISMQGRDAEVRIAGAPVIFAGHGVRLPAQGIDQLAGADVRGAVVLLLFDGPEVPGFPSYSERVRMVTEAGAAAAIGLVGPDLSWPAIARIYRRPSDKLAEQAIAPVLGAMSLDAVQRLVEAAGGDFARLLDDQPGSSFRAVALPLRATLEVTTELRPYVSRNVVGRLRGRGGGGESLLFLGHWDHLGRCRPEGEADRICNGAVDNASGIAALIEIAGRLGRGRRPERDILFLATTAEEKGLLGAEHFARHPAAPLASLVAAINLDTIALHPAGEPVAVIGRGLAPLDAAIAASVAAMGRRLDGDEEADRMVERQDGWALARAGVPAIMVGGSFADMARLEAFLSGPYHAPEDEPGPGLILDGAAEDANLLVALGRRLADPALYPAPARGRP